ncbi:MAG: VanW family protein, partial [Mycobacteriales bacterium]
TVVLTASEIPRGTHVLGVDIGGSSKSAAAATLRSELAQAVQRPIELRFAGKGFTVKPVDIGLVLDIDATVDAAAQRRVNPFSGIFRSTDVSPVVTIDAAKLRTGTQAETAADSTDMLRPTITFAGTVPKPDYGKPGMGLLLAKAAATLRATWLRRGAIELPKGEIYPETDRGELDALVQEFAQPAVSGPVTVKADATSFDIKPEQIAASLVFESSEDGAVQPRVDSKKLAPALDPQLRGTGTPAKDATVKVVNDKLVTTPSQAGVGVDTAKLAEALLPVLRYSAVGSTSGKREVAASMGPLEPELSSEQLGKLGIKQKISTFTTNFSGGEDRNKNILLVADEVDNAVVKPGDQFALNKFTGERGPAQGYVLAPVILDGKLKNEYGGGISQFATTLYNAIFFSGLRDVAHKAHSYYLSRYPAGREATVYYPSLDVVFKNDSPHGVLIDTSYTSSSITVSFWSTKRYDVESVSGPRTNPRPITTQYLDEPDCIATAGIPGFDITVARVFKQGGREVKRETIFTKYKAEPKFVCGKEPQQLPGQPAATPAAG